MERILSLLFLISVRILEFGNCDGGLKTDVAESSRTGSNVLKNGDFMTSAKVLTTLDFHGSDLHIYEHPDNIDNGKLHPDNRFYLMPVVEIDATSLEVHHSFLVDAFRMDFSVILWTDDLQNAAVKALERLYGKQGEPVDDEQLALNQVQMIPMEEVRLIWNSEVPLPDGIWLSRDWIPFSRNPHQLRFSFMCEEEDVCIKLKTVMKEHPSEFRRLNLEFTTSGKSSSSRPIRITGSSLTSSNIFRNLQNEEKFPGAEEKRYLTAEDLHNLSMDVTQAVLSTAAAESEVIPAKELISTTELLFQKLTSVKVSSTFMSEKEWNFMRWKPEITRPDKVVTTLNSILHTDDNKTVLRIDEKAFNQLEHNSIYAKELQRMKKSEGSSLQQNGHCDSTRISNRFDLVRKVNKKSQKKECGSLFSFKSSRLELFQNGGTNGWKTNLKEAGLQSWQISVEDFNNYLLSQSSYIEFDGENFVHKPVDVYQLSLPELTFENIELVETDVEVQKLQKIYHIKVAISSEMTSPYQNEIDRINGNIKYLSHNLTNDLTELKEQWIHERAQIRNELKDEVGALKQQHEHDVLNVRMEQQQQISAVRQEYKADITDSDGKIKAELEHLRQKDWDLDNLTRTLVVEYDALKAMQDGAYGNVSRTIAHLTDAHNTFRYSMTGEVNRLVNASRRLGAGDIAFLATTGVTRTVVFGGNAILDKVILDNRNSFNRLSGDFIAPVDGLYLFYFSLYLKGNGIEVRVYVDDTVAFKTRDATSNVYQYPSGTFMVQLRKDQSVHIKFSYQTKVYGDINTWFGGHLIKQL